MSDSSNEIQGLITAEHMAFEAHASFCVNLIGATGIKIQFFRYHYTSKVSTGVPICRPKSGRMALEAP